MAIILKAKKVNLCVSPVLFVFWYHTLNFLDTPHIYQNTVSYPKTFTLLSNLEVSHVSETLGAAFWLHSSQYLAISQQEKVTVSFKQVKSY
jgi:hypothetical protein